MSKKLLQIARRPKSYSGPTATSLPRAHPSSARYRAPRPPAGPRRVAASCCLASQCAARSYLLPEPGSLWPRDGVVGGGLACSHSVAVGFELDSCCSPSINSSCERRDVSEGYGRTTCRSEGTPSQSRCSCQRGNPTRHQHICRDTDTPWSSGVRSVERGEVGTYAPARTRLDRRSATARFRLQG